MLVESPKATVHLMREAQMISYRTGSTATWVKKYNYMDYMYMDTKHRMPVSVRNLRGQNASRRSGSAFRLTRRRTSRPQGSADRC